MSDFLKDKPKKSIGTILLIVSSLLMTCLGFAKIFTENNWILYGLYIGGALIAILGTFLMIKYFVKEEFLSVSNYGFATGLLLVVLGAITFIRAEDIAKGIGLVIGFILLIYGAILLQHSFAAFHMEGKLWWLILILSLITIASSVLVFLDFNLIVSAGSLYFYILLIANGIIVNISLITFATTIKKKTKATEVRINRTMEEDPTDFVAKSPTDYTVKDENKDKENPPVDAVSVDDESVFDE